MLHTLLYPSVDMIIIFINLSSRLLWIIMCVKAFVSACQHAIRWTSTGASDPLAATEATEAKCMMQAAEILLPPSAW